MSILTPLLPIVIMLIIVVAIFAAGFSLMKVGKKFFTTKITHWALLSYLIILLVATILLPFMSDNIKVMEKVDQGTEEKVMSEFYTKLQNGDIEGMDDRYLADKKTFKHDESKALQITSSFAEGTHVYVEKSPHNDGQIDVFVLRPILFVNDFDFSEMLDSIEITKKENKLHISVPTQDLHLSILSAAFPTRQLTGESIISHSSSSSDGIVYLRVPSNLHLTNSNQVFLNYVE